MAMTIAQKIIRAHLIKGEMTPGSEIVLGQDAFGDSLFDTSVFGGIFGHCLDIQQEHCALLVQGDIGHFNAQLLAGNIGILSGSLGDFFSGFLSRFGLFGCRLSLLSSRFSFRLNFTLNKTSCVERTTSDRNRSFTRTNRYNLTILSNGSNRLIRGAERNARGNRS